MSNRGRIIWFLLCANLLPNCGRIGFSRTDLANAGQADAGQADAGQADAGQAPMACSGVITEPSNGDGCCPSGANNANDADCAAICGNGVGEAGETCDPGAGSSAVCPTACDDGDACTIDELRGEPDQCDVLCAGEPVTAYADGDGCCPPGADSVSDSDCSPLCGNGLLEAGESCDPGSVATACPAGCDDGDVCTRDVSSGAAQTCNVACSNDPISMPFNEDGCCPPGANSINDVDCPPLCGNGAVEAGEQCDGGVGCSNCTLTLQGQCLAMLGNDACSQCACAMCTADMMNCYRDGDSQRDLRCPPVVECALAQQCTGTCGSPYYCYGEICWGAGNPPPNGPCKTQISAAAGGATTTSQVGPRSQNSSYPLYWSEQYGTCLRDQCRSECGI